MGKVMTIRNKMLGGFAIMAVIVLILGIIGIVSTSVLEDLSSKLHKLSVESDGVTHALEAHYIWRQNLTQSVLTEEGFTGSLDPDNCALGTWLKSDAAQSIDDTEVLRLLREVSSPHKYIHEEAGKVTDSINAGNDKEARRLLNDEILPKTETVINALSEIQDRYTSEVDKTITGIIQMDKTILIVNIAAVFIAFVVAIALAFGITKSMVSPLVLLSAFMEKAGTEGDITLTSEDVDTISRFTKVNDEVGNSIKNSALFVAHVTRISEELKSLANGDLTTEITELSEKDVMGVSVKYVANNLNHILTEINAASIQVSTGAKQVAHGSQALASGSTEQAAASEELSSAAHEIAAKIKTNAEMAVKASELANEIKSNAEKGSCQMDEMVQAVNDINDASQQIGKVIKTIEDIAFQTNILALNAAVEAARAGSAGKGFAVVAEEVRNLASKSAESAKDTASLIENSISKAELGTRIAAETADSLTKIVSGINDSSQLIGEIASLSEEQSRGISQINIGIDQVSQVIQQNSATAEESAAASEEMSGQSAMLEDLISQFKLK
ncbi:MAG: methyl-accepting chemotaxis protein [Oscillospiraceae bacterium]|nr:methyl-accepting chemotaxis protein [Oscillospiraceae bacterium]